MPPAQSFIPLRELPLRNDFMFTAVMQQETICQMFLQELLGLPIERIQYVDRQKDLSDSPEYHGVRLDVYLHDESGTVFNVEMQSASNDDLPRRARFYQGAIDRKELKKGEQYSSLSESYVIFVCNFDYFRTGQAVNERVSFLKDTDIVYDDGSHVFFLNSQYRTGNASAAILEFLDLVRTDDITRDYRTPLGRQTREQIKAVRGDHEWEVSYMTFAQRLDEERREAYAEGAMSKLHSVLQNLMKNMGLSMEQAMTVAGVSEAEREEYMKQWGQS